MFARIKYFSLVVPVYALASVVGTIDLDCTLAADAVGLLTSNFTCFVSGVDVVPVFSDKVDCDKIGTVLIADDFIGSLIFGVLDLLRHPSNLLRKPPSDS